MRLSTKIGAGFGLVISLTLLMFLFQSYILYEMGSAHRYLSDVRFQVFNLSRHLREDFNLIEEFTRKYFITRDSGFRRRVEELYRRCDEDLERLRSLELEAGERELASRIADEWGQFRELAAGRGDLPPSPEAREAALAEETALLEALRDRNETLLAGAQNSIQSEVLRVGERSLRAEWISLAIMLSVLGTSTLFSFFLVRSIQRRLDRLTAGTRSLARGNFEYRLSTGGRDELSDLAGSFNSMAAQLGRLDELKKDFVSHVSHELKAPLTSVQETIRLLLEEVPGKLNPDQKRVLELNLQSTRRLSSMIRNLLDLSRLEAGVMEFDFALADLRDPVRVAVSEMRVQGRENQLQIHLDLTNHPVPVRCDADRVVQVVENLLDNAIKFSPPRGRIEVSVRVGPSCANVLPVKLREQMERDMVCVGVTDQGPGLPQDQVETIFEKFHQVRQGRMKRKQGVGLGLTICHDLVRAHGGVVGALNRPEGGAAFYVLLPLAPDGEVSG